jgi:hypothetical protein
LSKIEIISGFVWNVAVRQRATRIGALGPAFSFDLGEPPVSVSMDGFAAPFDSGEYIAIAALVSDVGGDTLSALAYRRVGLRAPARVALSFLDVLGAGGGLAGLTLIALLVFVPDASAEDTSQIWAMSVLLVSLGAYCVYRLRLRFVAKRLLDAWVPRL